MQKLLTFLLLLLSSAVSGMDHNSENVGESRKKIKTSHELDLSNIQNVYRHEAGNTICYSATLKNGGTITADYFVAGSKAGQYDCSCYRTHKGFFFETSLSDHYYHVLKKIHEESLNK